MDDPEVPGPVQPATWQAHVKRVDPSFRIWIEPLPPRTRWPHRDRSAAEIEHEHRLARRARLRDHRDALAGGNDRVSQREKGEVRILLIVRAPAMAVCWAIDRVAECPRGSGRCPSARGQENGAAEPTRQSAQLPTQLPGGLAAEHIRSTGATNENGEIGARQVCQSGRPYSRSGGEAFGCDPVHG